MLIIIFLFSCSFLSHIHHVQAQAQDPFIQECSNSANYTSNSQFQNNLNLLLHSLVSKGARDGSFRDTIGSNPDKVYGLVQCRGDISRKDCETCLKTSSVEIIKRCPNTKSAALRYEYCILRYSNHKFSGQADGVLGGLYNTGEVSDADAHHFDQQLASLMNNLSTTAVSRRSRYDSGSISYKPFNDIYGLVQCTTDLSPTNCFLCLKNAISWIPSCCNRSQGAQIYSTTCYIRYELYPFVQIQSPSHPPRKHVDAPSQQSASYKRVEKEDGN